MHICLNRTGQTAPYKRQTDNSTVVFKSTASTYTSGEKEYTLSSGNGNMAYWLNNDFLANGNDGKKLPQAIIDNLAKHTYKVSQNMHWKSSSEELKVALLGKSEFLRYAGKFTAGKNYDEYWWLRDSQAINDGGEKMRGPFMVICNHNIVEGRTDASQTAYVRPTFWLNETFFTDVKLDVSTMGSEVKAMLANRYTDAQLKATGYSAVEIAKIKGADEVVNAISDVAVSDAEGKTTVSYTYMADGSAAVEKVIVALYNGGVLAGAAIEDKTVTKGANPPAYSRGQCSVP